MRRRYCFQFGAIRFARIRDQRFEPLRRARILEVVEPIEVKRRFDAANVALRAIDRGRVDFAHEIGHDDSCQ